MEPPAYQAIAFSPSLGLRVYAKSMLRLGLTEIGPNPAKNH
jgi:hypothetical protein